MEKTHSENVFFYFRRWNFLASRLKNFLYFSKNKFLIFQEGVSKAQKNKKNIFFSQKFIYLFLLIRIIHFSSEYSSSESMEFSSSEAIFLATYLHVPKNT